MYVDEIIDLIKRIADPSRLEHMSRYGINTEKALGASIYDLRKIAKTIPKNHDLALRLWDTAIHDARLLACFIDESVKITIEQMDNWADDFNSWDLCDQACTSLFDKSPLSWGRIWIWAESEKEFMKRGAFSLIAGLCVHDHDSENACFEQFFPLIQTHAVDERNYVKKSVSWALRNIGKRNIILNKKAISCAEVLMTMDSKSARFIGRDVLRELQSEKIKQRLQTK